MLTAIAIIAIGLTAVGTAVGWWRLRVRRQRRRTHTTATVISTVGRPRDDLRALVVRFHDITGATRTATDTFHSAFAADMVGHTIDIELVPAATPGAPSQVIIPRQTNPVFLLNILLGITGIAFIVAGIVVLTEAAM